MEKTNDAIIAEIKESINRLRCELDSIESRLSEIAFEEQPELEVFVEHNDEAVDIMLDDVQNISDPETFQEPELTGEPDDAEDFPFDQEEEPALVLSVEPAPEQASAEPTPGIYSEQVPHKKVFFESVMPDTMSWKRDIPGPQVQNILSAISLNDRVLFIKSLFEGDPLKFQEAVRVFNGCTSLAEAEHYIVENFPKWDMNSDVIYRFMMAVRRKLR